MVLRLIYVDSRVHGMFPLDPTTEVQAGQIGGLTMLGGDIFITLSDGVNIPPLGIIDEVRTEAFSKPILDEVIIIPSASVDNGSGTQISVTDVMGFLQETNINPSSFTPSISVLLNPKNGVITVPAGTPLNYDDGVTQGFEVIVSYTFKVADLPGEDSTAGTGLASVHFARGFFATDQFETQTAYQLNQLLYVSPAGLLTTTANGPAVAMVTGPPSALVNELEFLWF